MKKIGLILILFFFLCIPASEGKEIKFACVDINKALKLSAAGKEARETFQQKAEKLSVSLQKQQDELVRMEEMLKKQGPILSKGVREEREDEYRQKLKEFKRLYEDSKEELKQKEVDLTKILLEELEEVIKRIGKEKGYTIIFERYQAGVIIYADEATDITEEVVKAYNAKEAAKKVSKK